MLEIREGNSCIYNKGFHPLPFEIVANIFELSMDYVYLDPFLNPYGSLRNLLLVNSYFRNITVKIPALWTTVDVKRDPSLALQRTGSKGLVVEFSSIDDSSRSELFLRLLEPHIWRWHSFKLLAGKAEHVNDSNSDEGIFLKRLREGYKGKTFLCLEKLVVSYESESNFDWDNEETRIEPFPHAIQDRTTPARSFHYQMSKI